MAGTFPNLMATAMKVGEHGQRMLKAWGGQNPLAAASHVFGEETGTLAQMSHKPYNGRDTGNGKSR